MTEKQLHSGLMKTIIWLRVGAVLCLLISVVTFLIKPVSGWMNIKKTPGFITQLDPLYHNDELQFRCMEKSKEVAGLTGGHFQIIISSPVIIAGDIEPNTLNDQWKNVVRPVLYCLEKNYFPDGIHQPVVIYLCKNTTSFRDLAWKLDQVKPKNYYGYYHRDKRHLLVDISTGMGTLAHELTHILTHDNFPKMAEWLDEGISALHEECELTADRQSLRAYRNWRWNAAVEAVNKPGFSIKYLIEDRSCVASSPRTAYALSRAICLYLQEKNLLNEYVSRYQSEFDYDEQGLFTLLEVLGKTDLKVFDAEFRIWVNQPPNK